MNSETLKGHLPVLILGILQEQPLHGYAICQELIKRGGGWLEPGEGTVYPLLYRLERQGFVRSKWKEQTGSRTRKIYSVTPAGRRLVGRHREEWLQLAGLFESILGPDWKTS